MNLHNVLRSISSNDVKALGLDTSSTIEEKIPILLPYTEKERIRRGDF